MQTLNPDFKLHHMTHCVVLIRSLHALCSDITPYYMKMIPPGRIWMLCFCIEGRFRSASLPSPSFLNKPVHKLWLENNKYSLKNTRITKNIVLVFTSMFWLTFSSPCPCVHEQTPKLFLSSIRIWLDSIWTILLHSPQYLLTPNYKQYFWKTSPSSSKKR